MDTIISLNLNNFKNGTPEQKKKFVQDLGIAYQQIGFVAVYNHELSDELTAELYKSTKEFYALPLETKMKYHVKGLAGQRGFTSWGTEHSKDSKVGDLKEFYHFGQKFLIICKSSMIIPRIYSTKKFLPSTNTV
jgi:isopenicillin N synthase-like dioxygenase